VIVNFGCGANPAPGDSGYINVDGSLTVRLARLPLPAGAFGSRSDFVRVLRANRIQYGTARRLRFREDSLDGFYASHVLEHLSRSDCENLLSRVRRWLKPSGVLRVVLPDLKRAANSYVVGITDASQFVAGTHLAADSSRWWEILFGHSQHRWMYDAASFTRVLEKVGFSEIQEWEMHQGRLPSLNCLDISSRQAESFYIEACK
jgi:predicted SAM-dependent methyltransferase